MYKNEVFKSEAILKEMHSRNSRCTRRNRERNNSKKKFTHILSTCEITTLIIYIIIHIFKFKPDSFLSTKTQLQMYQPL